MSKRVATDQITRENYGNEEHSDEDSSPHVVKASADVLAKRKILKPRGKTHAFNHNNGGNGGFGSAFSFTSKDAPDGAEKGSANFSSRTSTVQAINFTSPSVQVPNKASFSFTSSGGVSSNKGGISFGGGMTAGISDDKNEKIKALNEKFVETINRGNQPNTVADFTPVANKYIEYYEKIQKGEMGLSQPSFGLSKSSSINNGKAHSTNGFALSTSAKEAIDEKPKEQTQKLAASNKADSSVSDSESEKEDIKIEGPKFTLSSKPTVKSSPFTFGPKPAKKPVSDSESESEVEIKGPTFTFNKPISDKVFKLDPSKASFTFNPSSEKKEDGKQEEQKEEKKDQPKPSFSFGTSTEKKEDKTPAFTFGASTQKDNSKPSFNFGASSDGKGSDEKPAFSFGATQKFDEKPAFSFGSNTLEKKDKSSKLFSFGKTADEKSLSSTNKDSAPKPFSFGSTSEKKEGSTNEAPKPAFQFSFNPPKSSTDKPAAFSFGSSNTNGTPLFGSKPASSFSFTSNNQSSAATQKADENVETVEEETGGDFEPVVKLSDKIETPQTGEENEEVLYTKRAKLMLFDPSNKDEPYSNKGLGELKVLKSKETNKSRLLIRADGGLRILLNTSVSKDMSYCTFGNGSMVRVPVMNPTTKSIETFVLKVKTPADGHDLLKVLNDAKQ